MYELKIVSQVAAAHQLRGFHGKCEQLHGHNWKIEVYVTGDTLGEDGLLIDFGLIKKDTKKVLKELDHKFLNELEPFKEELNLLWNVHTVMKRYRVRRALNVGAPPPLKANTVCNAVPILMRMKQVWVTPRMDLISTTESSALMVPAPASL